MQRLSGQASRLWISANSRTSQVHKKTKKHPVTHRHIHRLKLHENNYKDQTSTLMSLNHFNVLPDSNIEIHINTTWQQIQFKFCIVSPIPFKFWRFCWSSLYLWTKTLLNVYKCWYILTVIWYSVIYIQ